MSNPIYTNSRQMGSLSFLGVLLIVSNFSPKAIAKRVKSEAQIALPTHFGDSTPQHLIADLPTILPPATLPVNPRSTVNVPPLNRPAASKPSATTPTTILPTNRTPSSVPVIPAKISQPETASSDSTPPVIEFGEPLPKTK